MEPEVATEMVASVPSAPLRAALPAILRLDTNAAAFVKAKLQKEICKARPELKRVDWEDFSLEHILDGLIPGVNREKFLPWKDAVLKTLIASYQASLQHKQSAFVQQANNASLYVPAVVIRCKTKTSSKREQKKNGSGWISELMLRRLISKLLGKRAERGTEWITSIVNAASDKHLIGVEAERGLQAPGLLHAVARFEGKYDAASPPVASFENQALTPSGFVKKSQDVILAGGYIPVEGRKGFELAGINGKLSWYFDGLVRTFGDAVAFMSYVLSLTSPILPNGFVPNLDITFKEKVLELPDGVSLPAGVDGSGTYHPHTPELQAFLASNMALIGGGRKTYPVIQIRVWNPGCTETEGLFAKGLLVPDMKSFDDQGNPGIVLGLNQIKGVMKENVEIKKAMTTNGSVVLKGHMGCMKVWREQSTLKSCFELLQLVESTPETEAAVEALVVATFDSMRKKGPRALVNVSSGGNTTLERLIELVLKAEEMGVLIPDPKTGELRPVQMMDIKAVRTMAMDKLRRRLYNAGNGTGFEGNQVVIIMDASVKRGHVVIGSTTVETPPVGEPVGTWRFPAILAQSLKTLIVQEPSEHMLIVDTNGESCLVPYSAFMNPADVTDLQGDDDGDIAAWTTNPDVLTLASNLVDTRKYRIEPDGEKVKITSENLGDFAEYLSTDPMGPVGQATVAQARFYELAAISRSLYAAYRKMAAADAKASKGAKASENDKRMPEGSEAWGLEQWEVYCREAIDSLSEEHLAAFDVGWLAYRARAYNWARAFGVFIQECIDRAKRFVRWTDIPKLANMGDEGWATIGDSQELYCHWSWDAEERRYPWKHPGLAGSRTSHYLPLSESQLRTKQPLELLEEFTKAAKKSLGYDQVNDAVRWRRNVTVKGEMLQKRIDPDNFHPQSKRPGLVEVAFSATQKAWELLKGHFNIPNEGADLSDLVERMLDRQEEAGKAPARLTIGDKKVSWADFIRAMKLQACEDKYAHQFAYSRVMWSTPEGEPDAKAWQWVSQENLRLIKEGKGGLLLPKVADWLPQAYLDYRIRNAMVLGFNKNDQRVDLALGHNESEDDNPGNNPRIQAIEEAYRLFNRCMTDSAADQGDSAVLWLLRRYAFESANVDLLVRKDPERDAKGGVASYKLDLQRGVKDPLAATKKFPVAKTERALDILLYEGSPVAEHFQLGVAERCVFEELPKLRKAARVICEAADARQMEGYTVEQKRVEMLAEAIFSQSYLSIDMADYPHMSPQQVNHLSEIHVYSGKGPLYQCESCMAALKKEIVNENRYGKLGGRKIADRLTELAAKIQEHLKSDVQFAFETHVEHLRIEMLKHAVRGDPGLVTDLVMALKDQTSFRLKVWDVVADELAGLPCTQAETGDHVVSNRARVAFKNSAAMSYLSIYGFQGLERYFDREIPSIDPRSDEEVLACVSGEQEI